METTLRAITDDYQRKYEYLQNLVRRVVKDNRPRKHVTNQKSGNVHSIITRYDEVGSDAIAYCSFKYARAPVMTTSDLPITDRHLYCAIYLADVRADMPKP